MSPAVVVAVALGGASGALARYGVSLALPGASLGTFAVNVSGSLLADLVAGGAARRFSDVAVAGVAVGFAGSFTSFSAVAVEAVELSAARQLMPAAVLVGAQLVAGVAAAAVGFSVGRSLM